VYIVKVSLELEHLHIVSGKVPPYGIQHRPIGVFSDGISSVPNVELPAGAPFGKGERPSGNVGCHYQGYGVLCRSATFSLVDDPVFYENSMGIVSFFGTDDPGDFDNGEPLSVSSADVAFDLVEELLMSR
jgi:hypothetical protein